MVEGPKRVLLTSRRLAANSTQTSEHLPVPLHPALRARSPSPKGEEDYFNPRAFSIGSMLGSRPAKERYMVA